tara:strand:+ start:7112 stop:7999 length:888 start_codon:yes stop_codon:yes gene_type:complete
MGFLDGGIFGSMGGGSNNPTIQTSTVDRSPWEPQQQHLKNIFGGAETAFESSSPSYFQDSTVVDWSPQTNQAMQAMEARANAGSPLQQAGMAQAQSTIEGDYLNANPFLTGAYNAASAPVIEQWNNQIAPGIDSSFAGAGRMGSGLYAQQRNSAENTLGRNLTDMSSKMAYANYAQERQNQLDMAGQSGQMAQQDYNDMNKLMAVGGAREGQQQAQLQDQIQRFNFEQNRPWDQLARYSGLVSGGYGTQQETGTPLYSNPGANFLSGALGGATIGNMMGMPGMGAMAGGALGLLG